MSKGFMQWLAGFFEGDGCCGCFKTGKYRRLAMYVCQKDKTVVSMIRRIVGYGNIAKNSEAGINHITMWRWGCTDKKARHFLTKLLPYMRSRLKIKQVKKALAEDKKYVNPLFHCTANEREEIARYVLQGLSADYVAALFKRNRGTVFDIKREYALCTS